MFRTNKKFSVMVLAFTAALTLSSCSSTSGDTSAQQIADPFEDVNRVVFTVNEGIDGAFIDPLVEGYRAAVPEVGRTAVSNFVRNLRAPINLGNEILQGDFEGAGNVLIRTVVNTIAGIGGLIDVAGEVGYPYESEDFGQTLAVWGVGHGAYMVIPVIGPVSTRDSIGFLVDTYADPLRIYLHNIDEDEWNYIRGGVHYLTVREELHDVLNELERSSIDHYASVRSTYVQNRQALVNDNEVVEGSEANYPDFDDF